MTPYGASAATREVQTIGRARPAVGSGSAARRWLVCAAVVASCALASGCSKKGDDSGHAPAAAGEEAQQATGEAAQEPAGDGLPKVAFVYVGPVGDAGWTHAHDQARQDLGEQFPGIETTFREDVPEGPAAERTITQFAEKGYDIIFTTSFGFMDPTIAVAKRYPDTVFMHCSGYKRADNVGTYFGRMYQVKYLTGLIAGAMSKSGTIGYVASHPIPEVIRHINAFTIGVREVAPEATVRVVWTNSWFDPGKEKQAADALLDAGADIIAAGTDSAASLQAADARGAYAIGYGSDSRKLAPKAFLTAALWDWKVVYRDVVEQVKAGTWQSGDFWGGIETGVVRMAPLADAVPDDTKALVERRRSELAAGTHRVFAGPVKKQGGELAVAEGAHLDDAALLSMKWFVDGVVGTVPE